MKGSTLQIILGVLGCWGLFFANDFADIFILTFCMLLARIIDGTERR